MHKELAVECIPKYSLALASELDHVMPDSSKGTLQSGLEGLILNAVD